MLYIHIHIISSISQGSGGSRAVVVSCGCFLSWCRAKRRYPWKELLEQGREELGVLDPFQWIAILSGQSLVCIHRLVLGRVCENVWWPSPFPPLHYKYYTICRATNTVAVFHWTFDVENTFYRLSTQNTHAHLNHWLLDLWICLGLAASNTVFQRSGFQHFN